MITIEAVVVRRRDAAHAGALGELSRFRQEFYRCLPARGDALFELAEAVLCADGPVTSLAELSLAPEHRCGHGGLHDAINSGQIEAGRLRAALAGVRLPRAADGRLVLAVDVSPWLRPDAATSAERLFCHVYGRGKGAAQMIPGWPYSFVAALETGRASWTAVLDVIRLGPADDATAVTAAQLREVVDRLIAAGQWMAGDPEILIVADAGYDITRLAFVPADLPVVLLGRLRSDRALRLPAPPRLPGTNGRPPAPATEPALKARRSRFMRRVRLWLTGLSLVLAVAACGAGGGHPTVTASHAGRTGRGCAGGTVPASPGWRIVQGLPSEPGCGQPGGGSNDMLSVAAVSARDVWAVGYLCPHQCYSHRTLVEHWTGHRWRTIPPPPGRGLLIPPTVISASSATNVWVFGDADLTTRVSRWNGISWASFRFPGEVSTTAAAVFSRTDVWAFGELSIPSTASSRPYVVRFTGHRWLRVPSPLVPQAASAVAPNDIWTVGPLTGPGDVWAAARWNGRNWRTLRFPPLPPAVQRHAVIGGAAIQAYSARDAWVDIGLTTATNSYGIIVMHWNGQAWSKVEVPYRTQADGAISGDGRGGIWMYAIGTPAPPGAGTYLYHYSHGRWSRQAAPALGGAATEMGALSWRPGASSGWAATDNGNRGALLRYVPSPTGH